MAKDNEVSVIQTFGRWGSDAVLGYLREAHLGVKGRNVRAARVDSQMSLADLEARVSKLVERRLPKGGPQEALSRAAVAAIADEVAESALAKHNIGSGRPMSQACIEDLMARVGALEEDLLVVSMAAPPKYVVCTYSGSLHRALPNGRTPCGWAWRKKAHRVASALAWERARQTVPKGTCDRCDV